MKKTIFGLSLIGVIFLIVFVLVVSALNFRNTAVKLEKSFEVQYVANQSSYDAMWKKFRELAQVSDLQAEQVKEVYTGLISGRYENDAQVLFKLIREDNPKMIDTYSIIQQQLAADRNSFNNEQKKVVDKGNQYNYYIKKHFIWNKFFNYQEKDLKSLIVTSEKTDEAFKNKKDDELKIK